MISSAFKKRVDDGLLGKYHGLPNGLNRFNRYLYGIQRKRYYLYGGLSGSAKTTLVDFKLLNALSYAKKHGIKVYVKYYSFEIDKETKQANFLSCHIFNKHKKIIPPQKILGLGKFRLTEEEQELVNKELPYIDEIFSEIDFCFDPINPTGIYKDLLTHFNATGTFKMRSYKKTNHDKYGNEKEEDAKLMESYTSNDPNSYTICVIDHLALCKSEGGKDVKQTIDKISEYTVLLRNICGLTAMYIQQFNQGLNSVDRQKFKGIDISPQQNDFKDSTNPYQDCDCAIGIMNAYKMDMEECLGYDLTQLKNRFRMLKIIKNRGGYDNVACGLTFIPEGGYFKELPVAKEMDPQIYKKTIQYFNAIDDALKKASEGEEDWESYSNN
jgi:replicative DNA helicase